MSSPTTNPLKVSLLNYLGHWYIPLRACINLKLGFGPRPIKIKDCVKYERCTMVQRHLFPSLIPPPEPINFTNRICTLYFYIQFLDKYI